MNGIELGLIFVILQTRFINENNPIMSLYFLAHKTTVCKVESSENSLYWVFREQDWGDISH